MALRHRIIVSVVIFGAVAAGVGGAISGGALRVPMRSDGRIGEIIPAVQQVFWGGAPAYPVWPPEPLYPRPERTVQASYDDDLPAPVRPAGLGGPSDLPPPYEVWLDGEERPGPDDWRRNDWRDDGRREPVRVEQDQRQGEVRVYGQEPRYDGPPPGYQGPPPGYGPPPPSGYYGPPRG